MIIMMNKLDSTMQILEAKLPEKESTWSAGRINEQKVAGIILEEFQTGKLAENYKLKSKIEIKILDFQEGNITKMKQKH